MGDNQLEINGEHFEVIYGNEYIKNTLWISTMPNDKFIVIREIKQLRDFLNSLDLD